MSFTGYLIQRALYAVFILLAISFIVFMIDPGRQFFIIPTRPTR